MRLPPASAWALHCRHPGPLLGHGPQMIPGACMVPALEAGGQRIAGYSSVLLGPPLPPHGLPLHVASGVIPVQGPHLRPPQLCPAVAVSGRRGLSPLHHPHCLLPGILAPLVPLTTWEPHLRRAYPRRPGGLPVSRQWPSLGLRNLPPAMGNCLLEQRRPGLPLGVLGRKWLAWTTWLCPPLLLGPRPGLGDTAPSSGEGCTWHHIVSSHSMLEQEGQGVGLKKDPSCVPLEFQKRICNQLGCCHLHSFREN